MMQKGFVLTLDVLFAVLLTTVFLIAFSFAYQDHPRGYMLSKTGYDFMTSLDKSGEFIDLTESSQKQTDLQILVNKLPSGLGGTLSLTFYEYNNGAFGLEDSISATKGSNKTEKVFVRRMFVNEDSLYYGIAELEVWYD